MSLRLPAQLIHSVDQYAKYLGGSTDRTYVITQAIELALENADFQKSRKTGRPAPARVSA